MEKPLSFGIKIQQNFKRKLLADTVTLMTSRLPDWTFEERYWIELGLDIALVGRSASAVRLAFGQHVHSFKAWPGSDGELGLNYKISA
jgi:hypothetical protein